MEKFLLAGITFIGFTLVAALASGIPLMLFWNAVIPSIFPSVRAIDFGQAIGLMVICSLLFKNLSS
ncbi:hypothetical protein FACHB389_15085 [Nostoc calcicola FACHB-389]|nr:hypothetical protein FACHB389_15085 [Nostoc calcicola FACHB-389]